MVAFNPQIQPTQDPNWTNVSRPVEGPSPNQSGRIGLETIGEGLSGAVSLTDQTLKRTIDNTVNTEVDKQRDEYTAGLEKIKGQLDNGTIPAAAQTVNGKVVGQSGSVMDANASASDEDIPDSLSSGLDRIDSLAAAKRAGSVKLNDTQYSGNVLAIAKQLRSQYGGGYREYIDQRVSQASGLPVANSYYQNMLLDINRQINAMGRNKDEFAETMKWSRNQGNPAMVEFMDRYAKDPSTVDRAAVLTSVKNFATQQANIATDKAKRDQGTGNQEERTRTETANFNRNANHEISSAIEDNIAIQGLPTLKSLIGYMDDYQAGRLKGQDADQKTAIQRGEQLGAYENYYYRRLKSLAAPMSELGIDTEKQIQQAMAPISNYTKLMRDQQFGPAAFHNREVQAVKADEARDWLFDKDRSALSRRIIGLREVTGDQFAPQYMQKILQEGQDKSFTDLFSQEALSAVMPVQDARGNVNPRYFTDAIKHAKSLEGVPFEYYGTITNWTQQITDPNMPASAKDRLVDWAFNPKNIGVLKEFRKDYRDPNTGQWVDGKYRAFNIMTSPGMSSSIAETSKVNPDNYTKYRNWSESEFATLYRDDLKDLNKILSGPFSLNDQDARSIPFNTPARSRDSVNSRNAVHFSYDSESKEFGLVDKGNRPITREVVSPLNKNVLNVLDTLDRVNSGLGRIAVMHNSDPQKKTDTDQYLLKLLQTSGFKPGDNLQGATEGMTKALIKSRNPELTPEELNNKFLRTMVPAQGLE